ncbi:hypothetical protein [Mesorhizobium sp. IMUNJ 23232]|uniref:hypothetical protein n=1 Tax=Mesorhizobium sp. IMUNJ 23232 TaxID=3376064 RepID=UPI0037ABD328
MSTVPPLEAKEPANPWLILLAALAIPGAGHLMLGQPQRALIFLFFMAVFGWVTLRLMPEDASFFSRHSGAILIYGFCALDAYRIARVRRALWLAATSPAERPPAQLK